MPRMDGEALLMELQRRVYPAAVVMLTALGHDDSIVRCLRLGACDYLVKPVGIDELVAAAGNALQHLPISSAPVEVEYDAHGWFEISGPTDPAVLYKYRRLPPGRLDKFKLPETWWRARSASRSRSSAATPSNGATAATSASA